MSPPEQQRPPDATHARVQQLIQQLARRIQDRRMASVGVPGTLGPSGAPRAGENRTPPTSPPSPAQSAPSTLLRRLVADCPKPSRQRKVRA